jgi:wyosine [tRNA(Phe)-imidazoG37] synthetase (radical SAM superfamily)
VCPSFDAPTERTFKQINRPHPSILFDDVYRGLKQFSKKFKGILYLEMMFVKDVNDQKETVKMFQHLLKDIRYDKLYINTPIRPPAEKNVERVDTEKLKWIADELGGQPIDLLAEGTFYSDESCDIDAIKSIIKRHPMNHYEITHFLKTRSVDDISRVLNQLKRDKNIEMIEYNRITTYRMK